VHIDPNSPAGQEYAIPLQQTRRDFAGSVQGKSGASGGTGTSAGSSGAVGSSHASPSLFGAGITQSPPAAARRQRNHPAGAGSSTAIPGTATPGRIAAETTGSSVSTTGATAAIVAAVLALGLAFAVLLRRRRIKQG
jgi:MYXO-CTERM domain-containing protein